MNQEQTQQCRVITIYLFPTFQISYDRFNIHSSVLEAQSKAPIHLSCTPFPKYTLPPLFQPSYPCAMRTTTPSGLFKHQPKNPSIYYYLHTPSILISKANLTDSSNSEKKLTKIFCQNFLASFFMDCSKTYQMGILQQGFWQCEVPSA